MTVNETRLSELFDEFVPTVGKADTVAGEILRAVMRIAYRNYNDGDHIGVGYGKETCNPAARFLIAKAGKEIAETIRGMWGMTSDKLYDRAVDLLEEETVAYIENHPELKTTENINDMFDFRNDAEDVDDSWDDEEYFEEDY